MRLAAAALCVMALACSSDAARTLHLGSMSITEEAYRKAVHRLIRRDDEVCRTWLREGTEPLTAMEDKTTAGASASDLQTAMAIFSQECFALR